MTRPADSAANVMQRYDLVELLRELTERVDGMSEPAPKDTPTDEIEAWVNGEHPTGITSPWAISDDEEFADGHSNPCPCDQEPETRLHYLLNC